MAHSLVRQIQEGLAPSLFVPNQDTSAIRSRIETDYQTWLNHTFPTYVDRPFAKYHEEFWEWVWAIEADSTPRPFVAIWPRGAGKSTSTELACASVAGREARKYALYVCETQEQADDHVSNVAGLLESSAFANAYPSASSRKVGKFGNPRGWRRNRIWTASGFVVDAIGLDTAARGVKLDDERPDLIIFDDLDGELDSNATTAKKIKTLTRKLIPAGASNPAILAVQNLIIPDGIFSQLADGRADFMADRIVSGPHPAIEGMTYEQVDGKYVITGGEYTWPEGMGPAVCQADMDRMGLTAFKAEKQHDVESPPGGMFDHLTFRHCEWKDVPDLVRIAVWCDPAVTNTDQSDSHGIQADGIAGDDTIYRLFSWEGRTTPEDVLRRAILKAVELGADHVGVETDQGGDTWQSVYREAVRVLVEEKKIPATRVPRFKSRKAGSSNQSKAERASKMLPSYERGGIVHVRGTHGVLEASLRRFPLTKPHDLTDASYWSWYELTSVPKSVAASGVTQQSRWRA